MFFSELKLSKPLMNAVNELGLNEPTEIQKKAIPSVLSGKDIIGIAPTGTGKTFAYLIPILRDLKFSDQRNPRVLILVPTRELVEQVASEAKKLTEYMNIRIIGVYGGTNINTQKDRVYAGSDIIVATPGRLYDLTMTGILRLQDVQKLVIDECDEMLQLGFKPQLIRILELLSKKKQSLLFSATITNNVDEIARDYFRAPERIMIAPQGITLKTIDQIAFHTINFYTKVNLLHYLLKKDALKKYMIFTKSRKLADQLYETVQDEFGTAIGVLHSNKSQNFRLRIMEELKENELKGVITTDIMGRGIDLEGVTHVINFDIPTSPEQYIHRIGRTGRQKQSGQAISFVAEYEKDDFNLINAYLNDPIPITSLPENIEISERQITAEKEEDIHDAPTLSSAKHSIGQGGNLHKSKKENKKVNLKPKDKNKKKHRKKRR